MVVIVVVIRDETNGGKSDRGYRYGQPKHERRQFDSLHQSTGLVTTNPHIILFNFLGRVPARTMEVTEQRRRWRQSWCGNVRIGSMGWIKIIIVAPTEVWIDRQGSRCVSMGQANQIIVL
jgi:hypothetical protein